MKLHINIIIGIFLFITLMPVNTFAQNGEDKDKKTLDFSIVLGVNLGATAPLPLPEEVRKIESYNPKFNPQLGFNLIYNLNKKWAVGAGAMLDWKGMRVRDEVKYMNTSIVLTESGDRLSGYFVGKNMTNVSNTYLTVPIYAAYNFNSRWQARLGVYAATTLSSKFDGNVTDGYIRIGEPTGEKQEIDEKGATFDFSDDARDYDFGLMGGGEFRMNNRFGFYGSLTWGLIPYFYSGSNPIRFKMHNIYGTLGITYRFN